ncbi:hypothetical protein CQW23_25873 [Capsicum baccatum]|uniref:Transposase-associated domain-containing protein n=1 Tax=Capsicum baccatum TaxID=33114 RepID=A0A2G2VM72_CAPBA|nr:hypothetical protein CQW23_25873 [Capsicum baccatum]
MTLSIRDLSDSVGRLNLIPIRSCASPPDWSNEKSICSSSSSSNIVAPIPSPSIAPGHKMENEDRTWMYNRLYPNREGLREEYKAGVAEFNYKAMTLNEFLIEATIRCPCWNCKCCKLLSPDAITLHFYRKGFMLNYTVWTAHGESSAANNFALQNYIENPTRENNVESSQYSEMVRDAFRTHSGTQNELNDEANHFYE